MESRGCSLCGHLIFHLWAAGRVHGTSHSWPWRPDHWKTTVITLPTKEKFEYLSMTRQQRFPGPSFPSTLSDLFLYLLGFLLELTPMMTQKHNKIILIYLGPLCSHFTISICKCQRILGKQGLDRK